MLFVVASLALLAACVCASSENVVEHVRNHPTQSATGKDGAASGALDVNAGSSKAVERERRDAGQENDLLPSEPEVSEFGESSLDGRGRIKVLPAFMG